VNKEVFSNEDGKVIEEIGDQVDDVEILADEKIHSDVSRFSSKNRSEILLNIDDRNEILKNRTEVSQKDEKGDGDVKKGKGDVKKGKGKGKKYSFEIL
jgi:hypothetical protein